MPEIHPKAEIVRKVMGASYSVDIMSAAQSGWTFPLRLEELTAVCDRQLSLRYLLRGVAPQDQTLLDASLRRVVGDGWQIRMTITDRPSANCIVIDRQFVLMTEAFSLKRKNDVTLLSDPIKVNAVAGRFERLWERATDADRDYFVFEDEVERLSSEETRTIAVASKDFWDGLIHALATRPEDLYRIPARKFEELIAELLVREGLKTILTPLTRDGGRDILVSSSSPIGEHLFLVECKRYAPNRPVDVSIVRELFGVLGHQRATGALIATTSYFTQDAMRFREPIQYQMSFRDYDAIRVWLVRIASMKMRAEP